MHDERDPAELLAYLKQTVRSALDRLTVRAV